MVRIDPRPQEGSDWYVSFSYEREQKNPKLVAINESKAIGIDMGLKNFGTTAS